MCAPQVRCNMDVTSSSEQVPTLSSTPQQRPYTLTTCCPRLSFVATRLTRVSPRFQRDFTAISSAFIGSCCACQVPIIDGKYTSNCDRCQKAFTTAYPGDQKQLGERNAALKRHKRSFGEKHGIGKCFHPAAGGGGDQGGGQGAAEEVQMLRPRWPTLPAPRAHDSSRFWPCCHASGPRFTAISPRFHRDFTAISPRFHRDFICFSSAF